MKALIFWLSVTSVHAQCGSMTIAGSDSVTRLANALKTVYDCPSISIESGGSSDGAARVCGSRSTESPVDIGAMTRDWNPLEASAAAASVAWKLQCEQSTRGIIQIDVGFEGMAVLTSADGPGAECIRIMGGLTFDQLRWMYSSYNQTILVENDWNENAVPFSDGDYYTLLWSELDQRCASEEIVISGERNGLAGVDNFFARRIFSGDDETFRTNNETLWSNDIAALNEFLVTQKSGISFVALSYILGTDDAADLIVDLAPVPIRDLSRSTEFAEPNDAAFGDQSYPLANRLYMNLYDDLESLEKTRPFIDFCFSDKGTQAVKDAGFWPLPDWEKVVMRTRAQTASGIDGANCGPVGGVISIAGSSTVFPISQIWSEVYQVLCKDIFVSVEGGGSSVGAGRVCDDPERGSAVDIGGMSRPWKESEAEREGNFLYNCRKGDTTRSIIQIDVAIDGLTVAAKIGGVANQCIELIGGLTVDQLRWIYSSYTDAQLEDTRWNPDSLKASDRNSGTHLWSELDPLCSRTEIRIAGPDDLSGTYAYFEETILVDSENGETFDTGRPVLGYLNSERDEDLVAYIEAFGEAISYFGYSYYASQSDKVFAVPIQNSQGDFVIPTRETVTNGSYNPLARRIFLNVLDDEESIVDVRPFIKFGFAHPVLVETTGYVNLPDEEVAKMVARLDGAVYRNGKSGAARLSWVVTVVTVVVLIFGSFV